MNIDLLRFSVLSLCLACMPNSEEKADLEPQSPSGRIKIEEVFYSGSPPSNGVERYYSNQFIILRNVSQEPVDIGGMVIGDVFGLAGEINPGYGPDGFAEADSVHMGNIWTVPTDSPYAEVAPGGCVKIAHDAADHTAFSDLSHFDAHFETYVAASGEDHDDPIVENLESHFYTGGYDWLITVFGPTVVLMEAESLERSETVDLDWTEAMKLPSDTLVDSMEALMDADSGDFKRLHPDLDSGFVHVSGAYTGESVRRITKDGVLVDTDNSGEDFEPSDPVADCSTD